MLQTRQTRSTNTSNERYKHVKRAVQTSQTSAINTSNELYKQVKRDQPSQQQTYWTHTTGYRMTIHSHESSKMTMLFFKIYFDKITHFDTALSWLLFRTSMASIYQNNQKALGKRLVRFWCSSIFRNVSQWESELLELIWRADSWRFPDDELLLLLSVWFTDPDVGLCFEETEDAFSFEDNTVASERALELLCPDFNFGSGVNISFLGERMFSKTPGDRCTRKIPDCRRVFFFFLFFCCLGAVGSNSLTVLVGN